MDLDDDVYMRDAGPDSDPLEREDLEVQWKSSQTSNRALDSLMLEAAQNAHAVGRGECHSYLHCDHYEGANASLLL
jgi:hypothetical protein